MRTSALLGFLVLGSLVAVACGDDDPADSSPAAGASGKGGSGGGSSGKGGSGGSAAGTAGSGGASGKGGSAGAQAGAGSGGAGASGKGGSAGAQAGAGSGGAGASGSAQASQGGAGNGGSGQPTCTEAECSQIEPWCQPCPDGSQVCAKWYCNGGHECNSMQPPECGAGGSAGSAGSAGKGGSSQAGSGGSDAGQGGGAGDAGQSGASGQGGSSQAGSGGSGGSAQAGSGGSAGAQASGRWLMGYYPGYQSGDLPADDLRFDLMSHLAVGAVLPQADGTLDTSFYLGSAQQGTTFAKDLAGRASKAKKKAILMVGGAGAHDGFVGASQPATRAAFVANLVGFAKQNGFDGLDLDWEPLPAEELDLFGALASALRAAWPDAVLTLPIGPLNINYEKADPKLATIAKSLDQINVMTYSMAGAYDGWESWHHTALAGEKGSTPTSIQSSVDAFLKAGVPAAKLGIGEGFYGLCYTSPVTGPSQPLNGADAIADDNQLAYRSIVSTYLPSGTKGWDDTAKASFLSFSKPTGPLKCTYLSYTDEQSIAAHTDYVKKKGLGGAIVWTINEGHLPNKPAAERDPLLAALWNGLQ